mgnify:FL=1
MYHLSMILVWVSKIRSYENSYSVTGTIKLKGSDQRPKDRCKDSNNGTREAWNMECSLTMKY